MVMSIAWIRSYARNQLKRIDKTISLWVSSKNLFAFRQKAFDVLLIVICFTLIVFQFATLFTIGNVVGSDYRDTFSIVGLYLVVAFILYVINRRVSKKFSFYFFIILTILHAVFFDEFNQVISWSRGFVLALPIIVSCILINPVAGFIVIFLCSLLLMFEAPYLEESLQNILGLVLLYFPASIVWYSVFALEQLQREFHDTSYSLKETENEYRTLLSETNDTVLITTFEGTILEVNRQACKFFGEEKEKIIGRSFFEFIISDKAPRHHQDTKAILRKKDSPFSKQTFRKNSGELVSGIMNISTINRSEDKSVHFCIVIHETLNQELILRQERDRLARELHDSITQSLYSLTLFVSGAQDLVADKKIEQALGYLDEIGMIANQSIKEMRLLIYELQPSMVEKLGLVDALRNRMNVVEKRAGQTTHFVDKTTISLSASIEKELYYIALEALNNALKHAEARSITIQFCEEDNQFVVEVTDDGIGFDIDRVDRVGGGMGLSNIRSRVERLGGELSIRSRPDHGTTLTVKVDPLDDNYV